MKLRTILISLALPLTTQTFVACDDDENPSSDTVTSTTTSPDATEGDTTQVEETTAATETSTPAEVVVPTECDHEPICQDQQVSKLFNDDLSDGVAEELDAPEGQFLTKIDARAGGFTGTLGFTYAKFTREGIEIVSLADEDSLESSDWDIAFRRFVVRLNSGVAGPSCVIAATLPSGTEFGAIVASDDLVYEEETYYTGAGCTFRDDGTGVGAPDVVLASFWNYDTGCVAMTGDKYVLRLSDGHHIKLQIESYYDLDVQADCDEGISVMGRTQSAGTYRVRWAYLD